LCFFFLPSHGGGGLIVIIGNSDEEEEGEAINFVTEHNNAVNTNKRLAVLNDY
jgi:hypothetical protein